MTSSTASVVRKPCVFCGSTSAKKSKEDVWPVWLTKDVGFETGFDHAVIRGQRQDAQVIRSWSSKGTGRSGQRVGGVCQDCNNGWMARIEESAKPLIVSLRHARPVLLSRSHQKRVARWAYLKALVFSLATPEVTLPELDFHRFRTSRKPPQLSLIHLATADTPFPGAACKIDPLVVHEGTETYKVWRVLLLTGHLLLQVFSDRRRDTDPLVTAVRGDSTFLRCWTPQADIRWPPKTVLPPGEVMKLWEFYRYPSDGKS